MNQQINLYQPAVRKEQPLFSGLVLLQGAAGLVLVLLLTYGLAQYKFSSLKSELAKLEQQESLVSERSERAMSLVASINGHGGLSGHLDAALTTLRERQAVVDLLSTIGLDNTAGFSPYLRSLARQELGGIWLTRLMFSGRGDRTTLQGMAVNPELVPVYLQRLSAEPPFVGQGFTQFEIQRPEKPSEGIIEFSMQSEPLASKQKRSR